MVRLGLQLNPAAFDVQCKELYVELAEAYRDMFDIKVAQVIAPSIFFVVTCSFPFPVPLLSPPRAPSLLLPFTFPLALLRCAPP